MEKAASLLHNEELSIQDLIYDVGISSRAYFYKEFTRKFGVTPKVYREKLLGNDTHKNQEWTARKRSGISCQEINSHADLCCFLRLVSFVLSFVFHYLLFWYIGYYPVLYFTICTLNRHFFSSLFFGAQEYLISLVIPLICVNVLNVFGNLIIIN